MSTSRQLLFIIGILMLPFISPAQTTIVSYDFNSGNQGWSSNTGWTRGTSFPGNSSNHWRINPYNNNMNAWVTSPAINFPENSMLTLSLDVRYKTASNRECTIDLGVFGCYGPYYIYDGMNIEYSTNGSTWHRLGNLGEGINWYNNNDIPTLTTGWAGDNGGWQTASIVLPTEFAGKNNVRFRIRFVSNNTGTDDGVAFDNFVIKREVPPVSPGGVYGTSLWLKADQGITESGGAVAAWQDQSGNDNHATQNTNSRKPQYIPDALNGNPVVYFEQGPYMDGGAGFYTQQYFVVVDPNEIYNNKKSIGRIIGFENNGFGHLAFGPSTQVVENEIITHAVGGTLTSYRALQTDTEFNYGNPSLISSGNYLEGGEPRGQYVHNNGFQANNLEAYKGAFYNLNNQRYRLGNLFNDPLNRNLPFNGRIAELISYSSTLSSTARRDVETYLAIKYGITLDISTQNYTVNGTSIYGNKNYAKDIAGIGKNIASQGLNQTASKSVNQGAIIKMSNPSALDNGDYLVWGDDGAAVSWVSTSVPAGNVDRFARTWYVQETGNVGTVDVAINLNQLGIDIDNSTVNLFQAPAGSSVPNTFSTATAYTNGVRSTNSEGQTIVTFHGIDFSSGEYFTIGGDIQTTSPGGVKDNLSIWFKADGGVSLSGNSVMRWSDYSGNANDVYQGNNSLRPTYVDDGINFNPSIAFNNDYLDGIGGFYTHDYFVVAKPNTAVNRNNAHGAILGFESGQNSALALGSYTDNYNNEIITHLFNSGYQSVVNHNTLSFSPPLIINSKNNGTGTGQEIYVDGFLRSTNNRGTFANFSNKEIRIGSAFNGSPYVGQIAEVISYSSRLTDIKRRDVETYLAIKYGIALDITAQNYTARGNSIYNFKTHPNNIAGIARDLDNGFDQPRSKSSNTEAVVEMGKTAAMPNGSYLIWGKDGASATAIQTTELPSQYDERISAEYRVSVTGNPGAVTVKVYIGDLPQFERRSKTANFYSLLINNSGNFSTASRAIAASELTDNTLVFRNVAFEHGDFFTLAIPAIPSIGDNNTLWLRADKGLTLSGTRATAWADQSGLNNNATQAGTGPTLVNSVINGNHALQFDGNAIGGTRGFYTREYFAMADPENYSSSSNAGYIVGFESGSSGLALGNAVTNWANEVLTHIHQSGNRTALLGTANFSEPTIFNSRQVDGSIVQNVHVNGVAPSLSRTGGSTPALTNQPYRIGNNFSSNGAFNGKISEVLSFSTTQSNAEKRNIETYLALKYGITLNRGNYTLGGTIVYNAATTPYNTFANNVIGIISYAKYDFLQTTSRSINNGSVLQMSNASTLDNNDFIVIGDNGGAMTSTTSGIPAEVGQRVVRKWAVQTTNTPGTVTLSFDLNGLGYSTKNVNDFSLILDNNSNFANGISRLVTPTSWSGQVVTFTNVDLTGINYFGLGTAIDLLSDSDEDGIPNYFEIAYGTDPYNGNSPVIGGSPYTDTNSASGVNRDSISDALERILIDNGATGPVTRYTDTDGDGIPDWIEVKNGTNPFDSHSPTPNGALDSDGDGLPDALEQLIAQKGGASNANFTTDTDGDGVPDFLEIINNTNPNDGNHPVASGGLDSDGDGVTNAMEAIINAGGAIGSVDKESDTDMDGIPDYIEAITYTDPFNALSPSVPNGLSIRNTLADFSVSGGSCEVLNGHQWVHVLDQSGRLIFSINPVGNDLGSTCYGVRILNGKTAVRTNGTEYLLNRNWWIAPSNQPDGEKVYIRFYALGQEINDLQQKSVDVGLIEEGVMESSFNTDYLRITKIGDSNTLDPLVAGGPRTLFSSILHSLGTSDRIFTLGTQSFSSFVVHTTNDNTPLPIELLYFSGEAVDNGIALNWATSSEINHDYFVVERSVDMEIFEPIGKVKSSGNSNKKVEYDMVDHLLWSGTFYYRLKEVDTDGQFTYSKVISINKVDRVQHITIYPNPTKDKVHLQFSSYFMEAPVFSLFDLRGRKYPVTVMQENEMSYALSLESLSPGTYMIEIVYGTKRVVKRIIKE